MMIQKGKTEFLMGIDSVEQLKTWLNEHPFINGIAFIGRSNVGKSSLINSVFGKKTARVSNTPGRTRQVNIFNFIVENKETKSLESFYLFDVPGYGHAEVSKAMAANWQLLLDTFFQLCSEKILLLNIQDARHPLQETDVVFHDYIKSFNLETYLLFNKMDKLKTQSEKARLKALMPSIYTEFKWVKQIHFTSAEKGDGIPAVEQAIITFVKRNSDMQGFN
ncbi:MAG TPA: ribosome biogenesis GTP-binding protein YihA/YsxC [Bacteriovoracaceae bacterium]|nr:ribosome biogenesis GTP-binding protein YihA/YsxC [Bacteriovoracaceae bacterium]